MRRLRTLWSLPAIVRKQSGSNTWRSGSISSVAGTRDLLQLESFNHILVRGKEASLHIKVVESEWIRKLGDHVPHSCTYSKALS